MTHLTAGPAEERPAAYSVRLVTDVDELEGLTEPWRALAHACASPGALPGWQLAWWRNVAPSGVELRVVAVFSGDDLVGIAPFFTKLSGRRDHRLLGAGLTHRLAPLAVPGLEGEVARVVAETLAGSEPKPDLITFEGVDVTASWPEEVARAWPGRARPWRYVSSTHPAPVLPLSSEGFEAWFAGRSSNFRQQMRRARRKLEEQGGRTLLAQTSDAAVQALESFEALHSARWDFRGGSSLGPSVVAFLLDAARTMTPVDDLRVWSMEVDSKPVAVQVFLVAGGEILYFNGGFDDSLPDVRPAFLTMLAAIEDAFERGDRRLDFGGGDDDYKLRFATDDAPIMWTGIVPRTRRYALTRTRLIPDQAKWFRAGLGRKIGRDRKRQIKRLLGRGQR